MRYLARQPILEANGRVHAYELLYRSGLDAAFRGDGEIATRTMIDNEVLFGFRELTGGLPAFVNCTAETLMSDQVDFLDPSMTVLEILEDVEPTPELVAACRMLRIKGYRLSLDDFVWNPNLEPLIGLADYIKIDFIKSNEAERRDVISRLKRYRVALVAEKVESQHEFEQARHEGFTLFQGYYFCRPLLVSRHKIPANTAFYLQLLQLLQEDPLDLRKVSETVKRDASLTYRLLRLVNSPSYAIRQEVRSIQTALMVIGDNLFRRIATLAIACELNTARTNEVLRMAFVRARFCELSAELSRFDPMEQYLLGIFSMLPAMLRTPMEEVIATLPLREKVREALLGNSNDIRFPLQWLESHEQGDWAQCEALSESHHLDGDQLQSLFNVAALWADQILSATT